MVWAISRSVRRSLLPWMTAPDKIQECYIPIETEFFLFPPRPPEQHFGRQLLSVGFLNRQKGFDILFKAMGLLVEAGKDPSHISAGTGPEEAALAHLAEKLGIRERVAFKGYVLMNLLAPLYRECDVLYCPAATKDLAGT